MSTQKNHIADLLESTGLNWTVRKEEIQTTSGIIIKGHQALIRDDNNTPLSIMSRGYHPYQNHELLELLETVSQKTGLPIHNGGYFGDGEKVYIQLKSNDLKLGGDKVEGYVTGINSFDGSTSLAFGHTNLTVSCQNTFFAAFRELNAKVRHTNNMTTRIDTICSNLELIVKEEKRMFDSIKRMREVKISSKVKDLVVRALFDIDSSLDLTDDEQISTVTRNKMTKYYVDSAGEINEKGDNLWGLFSGVTKFTTHSLSKNDNTKAKLFGVYGNREREIFNTLVDMVEG